jgi:hypothetical protein
VQTSTFSIAVVDINLSFPTFLDNEARIVAFLLDTAPILQEACARAHSATQCALFLVEAG